MALDSACAADPLGTVRQSLHDLNNQLAIVMVGAELLADTPTLPDDLRGLIAVVLDGAEQASRVAGELQHVVRASASMEALASAHPG